MTPDPAGVPAMPAAVLWDMDGTLVATEPYWLLAETEVLASYDIAWTHEDGLGLVGMDLVAAAQVLVDRGVPLAAPELADLLVARVAEQIAVDVPWQPGARDLLATLAATGTPSALVTASYRVLAEPVAAGVPGAFATLVCGDEVSRGKPDPEPYLLAAERLGVEISECVAVEDSVPGVASALASGARTIAVEVMVPIAPVPGLSRVPSLAELTVEDLARVAAGETIDRLAPVRR